MSARVVRQLAVVALLGWGGFAWTADTEVKAPAADAERMELTIDQALDMMRRNNPGLVAANAGVEAARAATHAASRLPNPVLSLENSGVSPTHPRATTDTGRTYAVGLEQLFETAGKRRWRTMTARNQELSAEASASDALRQLTLAVYASFYGAILAREDEALADEVLASIARTEALMRTQVTEGDIPAGDLVRFQVGRVQYQQAKLAARLRYDQAISDLVAAIAPTIQVPTDVMTPSSASAWHPGATVVPNGDLIAPPSTTTLEDLRARAGERPDVLAAKRQVDAANAALRLAEAQRVPDVTVGVGANLQGAEYTVGVSASIELPVFNTYRGASAQAAALLRQAEAQYLMVRTAAVNDVEKVWLAYDSSRQVLAVYSAETLARARHGLEISEAAYREGATGLIDVLEARRAYDDTRSGYNQALFAVRLGLVQVEHLGSLGGSSAAPAAGGGGGGGGGGD